MTYEVLGCGTVNHKRHMYTPSMFSSLLLVLVLWFFPGAANVARAETARPNLIIIEVLADRYAYAAGSSIEISYTVKNIGDAAGHCRFSDRILLRKPGGMSNDSERCELGTYIPPAGAQRSVLAPGESVTRTFIAELPQESAHVFSRRWIEVRVDVDDTVAEQREGGEQDNHAVGTGLAGNRFGNAIVVTDVSAVRNWLKLLS